MKLTQKNHSLKNEDSKTSVLANRIMSIGIIVFFVLLFGCISTSQPQQSDTSKDTNVITLNALEITNQAKWFEYNDNGVIIKFMVVRGSDGVIRTAFDACDVCYGAKKGYRQEGNYMICNNCGNTYPIDSIGTENKKGGGCWPGYLPSTVEGNNVVIQKTDLEKGKYRFA